jgi:DNA-binding response OmpR family regulator
MKTCPTCGQCVNNKPFSIDYGTGLFEADGKRVYLNNRMTQIIGALIDAYPSGLSNDRLRHAVYGHRIDGGPGDKVLDVTIHHARKMLRLAGVGWSIRTNRGVGYFLARNDDRTPQIRQKADKRFYLENQQRFIPAMRRETEAA